MIVLVFLLLVIFCILYANNARGDTNSIFSFVLKLLIILTLICSFFADKWWFGLIAVFLVFVLFLILKPIIDAIRYRIMAFNIREEYDYNGNTKKFLKKVTKRQLFKIFNSPEIRAIMYKNKLTFDDFYKLFNYLDRCGLKGKNFTILKSPNELEELIQLLENNATKEDVKIYFNLPANGINKMTKDDKRDVI